jgi:hypothetical protein
VLFGFTAVFAAVSKAKPEAIQSQVFDAASAKPRRLRRLAMRSAYMAKAALQMGGAAPGHLFVRGI